jgi:hypothetical protein
MTQAGDTRANHATSSGGFSLFKKNAQFSELEKTFHAYIYRSSYIERYWELFFFYSTKPAFMDFFAFTVHGFSFISKLHTYI